MMTIWPQYVDKASHKQKFNSVVMQPLTSAYIYRYNFVG